MAMSNLRGVAIVFEEGDPPSEVYPLRGTIIGDVTDEQGQPWWIVQFEGAGYTFHPDERVLVRPRWQGRTMEPGARLDVLTKRLPLGTDLTTAPPIAGIPFGAWVTASIAAVPADPVE